MEHFSSSTETVKRQKLRSSLTNNIKDDAQQFSSRKNTLGDAPSPTTHCGDSSDVIDSLSNEANQKRGSLSFPEIQNVDGSSNGGYEISDVNVCNYIPECCRLRTDFNSEPTNKDGDSTINNVFCNSVHGSGSAISLPPTSLSHLISDSLPNDVLEYDFSTYIRDVLLTNQFTEQDVSIVERTKTIGPKAHRMMYILNLLKITDTTGATLGAAETVFGNVANSVTNAEELDSYLNHEFIKHVCLSLEAATKQQAGSDLWHTLRRTLLTASTIRWKNNNIDIKPSTLVLQPLYEVPKWGIASINFGKVNEPQVRAAITTYRLGPAYMCTPDGLDKDTGTIFSFNDEAVNLITRHDETNDLYACGLLLDPSTCMIGASIDLLVCDRNSCGIIHPHKKEDVIQIYEIKCRPKYMFYPDDNSEIAQCYERLLNERSEATFRRFIYSCNNPCVEFFEDDDGNGLPSVREALVTINSDWRVLINPSGSRKRAHRSSKLNKNCAGEESTKRHMALNKNAPHSEVWLFGDTRPGDNRIYPLDWKNGSRYLHTPVFANPRHSNFKQITVQTYVLSRFYPQKKIESYLVTFIGRNRRNSEVGKTYILSVNNDNSSIESTIQDSSLYCISPEQAIPVILIITPVIIDPKTFSELESTGISSFDEVVDAIWGKIHQS